MYGDSSAVTWAESDVIWIVIWYQNVVLALKQASWVRHTWGLFFSYLSYFIFSLGKFDISQLNADIQEVNCLTD